MSMALKYAMAKKMAKGGMACDCGAADCPSCSGDDKPEKSAPIAGGYAEGGIVEAIMMKRKKPSEDFEPDADEDSADFDEMDELEAPHTADYTGANSGDEIGNEEEDEHRRDIVARIMRSRAKKDKMPRPA